jgi:nucleotide-binding universal stress UspA family protein
MSAGRSRSHVVAGVDGSAEALRAVRWAAREAHRREIPLRLVSAFEWAGDRAAVHRLSEQRFREVLGRMAGEAVAVAEGVARAVAPEIDIERQVTPGAAIDILRNASATARMLVLGDRGSSRMQSAVAGSVAVAMTTGAYCPVVIVRGDLTDAQGPADLPIVVGIDGSATSERATGFAFEEAAVRRVPLIAVHTWWDPVAGPALARFLDLDAVEADERRRLDDRLAGWSEKYPEVPVGRSVTRELPAHALMDHASRAQLVVVGSRGRGDLAGLVLGSVSNALVHGAPCPVAVVGPASAGRLCGAAPTVARPPALRLNPGRPSRGSGVDRP